MSFAVVVPVWRECKFYSALMGSTFRRGEPLMLPADEHVYVDGAQHSRPAAERERPSSYDTAIFFLQTDEAAEKWPVGEQQRMCIRAAMRPLADKGERKGGGGVQDRLREIERRNKRRKLARGYNNNITEGARLPPGSLVEPLPRPFVLRSRHADRVNAILHALRRAYGRDAKGLRVGVPRRHLCDEAINGVVAVGVDQDGGMVDDFLRRVAHHVHAEHAPVGHAVHEL